MKPFFKKPSLGKPQSPQQVAIEKARQQHKKLYGKPTIKDRMTGQSKLMQQSQDRYIARNWSKYL